jgi:hypothetical protein
MLQLHTTRSWHFMGLSLHTQIEKSSKMHLKFGDDVIVGVHTGICYLSITHPSKTYAFHYTYTCWREMSGDPSHLFSELSSLDMKE